MTKTSKLNRFTKRVTGKGKSETAHCFPIVNPCGFKWKFSSHLMCIDDDLSLTGILFNLPFYLKGLATFFSMLFVRVAAPISIKIKRLREVLILDLHGNRNLFTGFVRMYSMLIFYQYYRFFS